MPAYGLNLKQVVNLQLTLSHYPRHLKQPLQPSLDVRPEQFQHAGFDLRLRVVARRVVCLFLPQHKRLRAWHDAGHAGLPRGVVHDGDVKGGQRDRPERPHLAGPASEGGRLDGDGGCEIHGQITPRIELPLMPRGIGYGVRLVKVTEPSTVPPYSIYELSLNVRSPVTVPLLYKYELWLKIPLPSKPKQ